MTFCEALRMAREKKGLTQQQVADAMDITKSTYCGYETGKRQPDVNKIKQISKILGVPADQLLQTGFEKEKPHVQEDIGPNKQAVFDLIDDLSESEAALLLERVKKIKESRV